MSVARRLDRLERLDRRHSPAPIAPTEMDAEMERLAAELEAREGPGAFAALIAEVTTEFETANSLNRDR